MFKKAKIDLNTYLIADLHLGHKGIIKFSRTEFETLDQHHAAIVERWNSVVCPNDKILILGDLAFTIPELEILHDLKGSKILVMGNHDLNSASRYLKYVDDIGGAVNCTIGDKRLIFTHIPIHPNCMRWDLNIHGHLHGGQILDHTQVDKPRDLRYYCVSWEILNGYPVKLGTVLERIDNENHHPGGINPQEH